MAEFFRPKTEGGKARACKNAYKHGLHLASFTELKQLLRLQAALLAEVEEAARGLKGKILSMGNNLYCPLGKKIEE